MSNAKVEIRGVIVACLSGIMAGTAHTEEPKAAFQVKTRKADDHVTARIQGDRAVLAVTSRSGIGGATIARQGERWQRAMIIRLQLRGMERLQVGNGRAMLTASVSSSGDYRIIQSLWDGGKEEVPIDRSSPYWTEVRILDDQGHPAKVIPLEDGVFEVTLPPALFASNPPKITLDWIDFYR